MKGMKIVFALCITGMLLLNLPMADSQTLAGEGTPISGVDVRVGVTRAQDDGYESNTSTTDAAGYYEMNIPPGTFTGYYFDNVPEGYFNSWFVETGNTTLNPGERHEHNMSLTPIPAQSVTIQGYLTDENGDAVVVEQADHTFNYYWTDNAGNHYMKSYNPQSPGGWITDVGTGQTGYFSFTAPPGDFEFSIHPDGYIGLFHPRFSADSDRWANFTLEREPVRDCWINGTVTESGTNGTPIEFVGVRVNGTTVDGKDVWEYNDTEANGQYSIPVPAGNYWVEFMDQYNHMYVTSSENPASLPTPGMTVTVNAALDPIPHYTLNVQVNNASSGLGIDSIWAEWEMTNPEGVSSANVLTNGTGFFTAQVEEGVGNATAPGSYDYMQEYYPSTQSFSMPADDGSTITLDLTPVDRVVQLNGTVTGNATTRAPLSSVDVKVQVTNAQGTITKTVYTDFNGFYEIYMPTGSATITVGSWASGYYGETVDISDFSAGSHVLDFDLTPISDSATVYGWITEGPYSGGPTPIPDDLDADGVPDTPGDVGDTTPPGAISNLAAGNVGTTTIDLAWTATGDNATTGTAYAYKIGHSTTGNFSDLNASNVHLVSQALTPKAAGQSESFQLTGLMPNTTYWIMVGVLDDAGNYNKSNILVVTTLSSGGTQGELIPYASGGTVSLSTPAGSASVEVPANALSSDTQITVEREVVSDTSGWNLGSNQAMASDIYNFGPDGTLFNSPVTISLPYDAGAVPDGWNLGVYGWNLDGMQGWNLVGESQVDATNGVVRTETSHFSRYAVLATAQEDEDSSAEDDIFGLLGYIGPIPILLIAILLAVVLVVAGVASRKKEKKTPPPMPKTRQAPPPRYPPQHPGHPGGIPPPPGPGTEQPAPPPTQPVPPPPQPAPEPAPEPIPEPKAEEKPEPIEEKMEPTPAAAPGKKEKPSGGKCSQCGKESLSFYDDGSGVCEACGRTFWWDKSKAPHDEVQEVGDAEEIAGGLSCPECGSTDITTYPDGSHICDSCENAW